MQHAGTKAFADSQDDPGTALARVPSARLSALDWNLLCRGPLTITTKNVAPHFSIDLGSLAPNLDCPTRHQHRKLSYERAQSPAGILAPSGCWAKRGLPDVIAATVDAPGALFRVHGQDPTVVL